MSLQDKKHRVHIGDLRHNTVGRHSAYMPIAIGYIGAYAKSLLQDQATFDIHADPDELIAELKAGNIDVLALSNYCWNAELSLAIAQFAKSLNPDIVVIAGGPEFPTDPVEIHDYLRSRDAFDFYIFNYEGEVAFVSVLGLLFDGVSKQDIQSAPPPGVATLDQENNLRQEKSPDRLRNLDVIPSPFLTGMMDKFFNGTYMPFLETMRGCPYACTYCVQGSDWYNKIYGFSTERIVKELDYIGKRMVDYKDVPLAFSDSNFGMYKRDLETADAISELSEKYDWPRSFIVDTGKSQLDRLISVALKLNRKLHMSISPQSLNPDTLASIKRKNLGEEDLAAVYEKFKEHGISTNAAIIVPLPEETKESYIQGLRSLATSQVDTPMAYITMLLKGTSLASKENRSKFGMQTSFRPLPRQISEVNGRRVFEFDEVCITTNTMTYEEFIECRCVSFIFILLSAPQFDFLRCICNEIKFDWFDLLLLFWKKISHDDGPAGDIYKEFIQASHDELFTSPQAIQEFFNDDEIYEKLISGELGENVMRNFIPKLTIIKFRETSSLVMSVIRELSNDADWLESMEDWIHAVRDIYPLLEMSPTAYDPIKINLDYDIESWYWDPENKPISDYRSSREIELFADADGIKNAVSAITRLYGPDPLRWLSRLVEAKPFQELWRKSASPDERISTTK